MPKYTLESWNRALDAKIRELKKVPGRSSMKASKFLLYNAKRNAPRGDTGKLRLGLRRREKKNGVWQVTSTVPGSFPYNFWVDQRKGFRTLKYKNAGAVIPPSRSRSGRHTRVIPPGGTAIYGSRPAGWAWTGEAGFFTNAVKLTRRQFGKGVRQDTKKALMATA